MTRYKGAITLEQVGENAKKAKTILEKHGAELFRVGRFHTGNLVGERLVVTRYPSWAAHAKAQESLAKDAEYQQLLAHAATQAEVTARNIVVGVDF
jgi:uncharacterized protein (DUF1330 family)